MVVDGEGGGGVDGVAEGNGGVGLVVFIVVICWISFIRDAG